MPLLSFEGVDVEVPAAPAGLRFSFLDGVLAIECANFTGAIVMTQPAATNVDTTTTKAGRALSSEPLVVQATQSSTISSRSSSSSSKKRLISDEQDDPDMATESDASEREDELLRKRARPNFLSDVEQSMLLAQLEASQQSLRDSSVDLIDASQPDTPEAESPEAESPEAKSPEKMDATTVAAAASPADFKTPAKAKKPAVSQMKSFFSPEPKELATKKATTDSTQGKRGSGSGAPATSTAASTARPPTGKPKTDATQISIRDMMLQAAAAPAKAPTKATAVATSTTAHWSVVESSGAVPAERWGHTVTKISENRVVVYGGADDDETTLGDLHVFDLATHEWSKPLNCESIPRTWHDAVYLESKHLLLVFGGERAMGDDQLNVLADIMVLDTECFLWYPPAVSGVTPTARSGHACTVVGNDVVVFGGSRGRSRQSSVHVLDSDSWHWKTVKVEGKPPTARTYHSAVAVGGDSVVYFGGNDAKKSFDSVHVLRKSSSKPDVWTWFHPCVVGATPRARTGHSATLVDASKILVFGGWDPQSGDGGATATSVFDDAFLLDTTTWEWEPVEMAPRGGDALPGRVGHSAVLAQDNAVLLFGGQNGTEQRLSAVHALSLGPAEHS